jgi:CBS domain-containing protein
VFVTDEGRLTGVITRKTLVREVVARGRSQDDAPGRCGAANATIERSGLADAFAFGRRTTTSVPVVEDGRLVGVRSRSAVQRRLAEDEPPDPEAG